MYALARVVSVGSVNFTQKHSTVKEKPIKVKDSNLKVRHDNKITTYFS